jgi:hypothetical protein
VTEAQIAETVGQVGPYDSERDFLRKIVGKSIVQWRLKHLSKDNIGEKRFGFSVSTSTESDIKDRAHEDEIVLTDAAWAQINADIMRLERNACNILRNNNIVCNPEEHGDNDLSGSAWIKTHSDDTQTYALPSAKALRMLLVGINDLVSTYSGNISEFDPKNILFDGVSNLGQKLIDVSIRFFGTEELNLDDWEEVQELHPELWGPKNESKKEYLDFNTVLGPPEKRNVYVKNIEGVPIFSVRCYGCKRIHGNFRTFDEASGNAQCKYCNRDYVDMMLKANETGKYKNLLKKHDKRAT